MDNDKMLFMPICYKTPGEILKELEEVQNKII
jgi:hypothetical protein